MTFWTLYADDEVLSSSIASPNDDLDLYLGLYSCPCKVIWICREITETVRRKLDINNQFILNIYSGESASDPEDSSAEDANYISSHRTPRVSLLLFLDKINWKHKLLYSEGGAEIHFTCSVKKALQSNSLQVATVSFTDKNLKDIITKIINNLGDLPNLQVIDSNYLIENYFTNKLIEESITQIANDFAYEYYAGGESFLMGPMVAARATDNDLEINDGYVPNTIFKMKRGTMTIISGALGHALPEPGSRCIIYNEPDIRLVFTHLRYRRQEGCLTTFISCDEHITEKDFLELLPEDVLEIIHKQNVSRPQVSVGTIKENIEGTNKLTINPLRKKNKEVNLNTHTEYVKDRVANAIMIESSPYAGKTVGLQFPYNQDGKCVYVNADDNQSNGIIVGQINQRNEFPAREDINDFRLTLPDGATLYYDNSEHTYTLCAKTKVIIGIQSNVSSEDKPVPTTKITITDGSVDVT